MKFVIRPAARDDILRQYRFYLVEHDAEKTAHRFLDAIQDAIEKVCKQPGIGALKATAASSLAGLRSWPVKGFPAIRIYYLASGNTLRILRVLHGRRDLERLWEDEE